jgi:hypothetical protein
MLPTGEGFFWGVLGLVFSFWIHKRRQKKRKSKTTEILGFRTRFYDTTDSLFCYRPNLFILPDKTFPFPPFPCRKTPKQNPPHVGWWVEK